MASPSPLTRTVRFLDGSLVTFTVPDSSQQSLIREICTHHPDPIHPMQVVLSNTNDTTLVLILPHKHVVLSDFRHILSDETDVDIHFFEYSMAKTCNTSLLRHLLHTTPEEMIPLDLFRNDHSEVVKWLFSSGHVARLNAVKGPISAIQNERDRAVYINILQNPAPELVECLLYRWETEDVHEIETPNSNMRVLDALYTRCKDNATLLWPTRQVLNHPHATEEMIQTILPTMSNVRIYEQLQFMLGRHNEFSPHTWRLLYEKWQTGPFAHAREIRTEHYMCHLKQYSKVFEHNDLAYRQKVFWRLASTVCDSDEVAEWLLSAENEIIRAKPGSFEYLAENTHPRIVKWVLEENGERWKDVSQFCVYNTHPLAVAKTVEWWLDPSEKCSLPSEDNLEALWPVLTALHDSQTTSGIRGVSVSEFVAALQFSDAEIVFDL